MNTFAPRQGQREILEYTGGMMAVSAVPGSGKTATIAALTAKLLTDRAHASGWAGPLEAAGRILIVTYQNAAVDHLRARIRHQLSGTGLPQLGYDIRTLHGLAYSIVQSYPGQAGTDIHRPFDYPEYRPPPTQARQAKPPLRFIAQGC